MVLLIFLILYSLFYLFLLCFIFIRMGKSQDQTPELDSPHTEASKLLEAALQQMDGIISG